MRPARGALQLRPLGEHDAATGAPGAVLDSYSYLPFGDPLSSTGTRPTRLRTRGSRGHGAGDGLYDMRNRFYAAGLGRFTSPDPTAGGGDLNFYRSKQQPDESGRSVGLWSVSIWSGAAVGPIGFEVGVSFGTGGFGITFGDNVGLGVRLSSATVSTADVVSGQRTSSTAAMGVVTQWGNNGAPKGANKVGPAGEPGQFVSFGLGLALGSPPRFTTWKPFNHPKPPPDQKALATQAIQDTSTHNTDLGMAIRAYRASGSRPTRPSRAR